MVFDGFNVEVLIINCQTC